MKYLDKLVDAKEIIYVDNLFSLKNAYKKDRTWYKREVIQVEKIIDFKIDNNLNPIKSVYSKIFEQDNIKLELKTYIRKINYKEDLYIATTLLKIFHQKT